MKLFYREIGSGGQNIIILHGLFGSSDNWLTQSKMLSDRFHIYLPDQRNHGQSPHSDEFNYKILAEDLNDFIQDNAIQHPVLIGHSMGGKAAMNLAIMHPEAVNRLIVVDIAPKAYPVQHEKILEGLLSIPVDGIESRNEADEKLSSYVSEMAVRQFLLKNLQRKIGGNGFTWKMNLPVLAKSISAISDPLEDGKQFDKPVLFIRGKRSDYILDDDMDSIQSFFPKARLITLDTGHWVQAERPMEFVEQVVDFLDDE
jgi:esterase